MKKIRDESRTVEPRSRRRFERRARSALNTVRARAACVLVAGIAGAAPAFARADDVVPVPVARVMMGPAIHVTPNVVEFALDVTAGAGIVFAGGHGVGGAELGYSYDHIGMHAFDLVGEIGVGSYWAFASYRPHLLLGTQDGVFAAGMRNAVGGHFLLDLFDIEVGHQFIASNGSLTQGATVMFGFNPATFIFVLSQFANH